MARKPCRTCGLSKPIGDFYRHRSNIDGLDSSCKGCRKRTITRRQRERYREDPAFRHWCRQKKRFWLARRSGATSGAMPGRPVSPGRLHSLRKQHAERRLLTHRLHRFDARKPRIAILPGQGGDAFAARPLPRKASDRCLHHVIHLRLHSIWSQAAKGIGRE